MTTIESARTSLEQYAKFCRQTGATVDPETVMRLADAYVLAALDEASQAGVFDIANAAHGRKSHAWEDIRNRIVALGRPVSETGGAGARDG